MSAPLPVVRIVIFAKAPRPGEAKTRLISALGPQGAANLARRMLLHAVEQTGAAGANVVELCCTPADEAWWQALALPATLAISDQGEGSLGERMARACARVIGRGEAILLIGTDCPQLTSTRLRSAVAMLRQADQQADALMIPAHDGGYVALGLRRHHPLLFSDIRWSTSEVAAATQDRFRALGWTCQSLAALPDIDEPADLQHLPRSWGVTWPPADLPPPD